MQPHVGCELSIFIRTCEIRHGCLKNHGTFCLQHRTNMPVPKDSLSMAQCFWISLPFVQGEKNFLLGTESVHLQRGHILPKDRQCSQGCCLNSVKKELTRKALLGSNLSFKHKEYSAPQVNKLGVFVQDPTPGTSIGRN